jgi:hypothetical protein
MSHFSTVQVSYSDTDALMAALAALGYTPQWHQEAVPLRNDWGTATEEHKAEIVVPMPGKADVGFAYREGVWHLIADDYELRHHAATFRHDLALQYATLQAQQLGYQVVQEGNALIACPIQ